jgi:hypothetical protein
MNPLKKFIDKVRKPKAKAAESEKDESTAGLVTHEYLERLTRELQKVKTLLLLSMLEDEGSGFSDLPGGDPVFDVEKTPMAHRIASLRGRQGKVVRFDVLDQVAGHKLNQETQKKEYVLHRACEAGEYERSVIASSAVTDLKTESRPQQFKTDRSTVWWAEYISGEKARVLNNPMISCLIPDGAIEEIHDAVGPISDAWTGNGGVSTKALIRVVVKPGTYQLFQELKKSVKK